MEMPDATILSSRLPRVETKLKEHEFVRQRFDVESLLAKFAELSVRLHDCAKHSGQVER